MLKKFGLVTVGVTAGLLAVAPAALADGSGSHGSNNQTCEATPGANGSTTSFDQCNNTGKNVGQNNVVTVNGTPIAIP